MLFLSSALSLSACGGSSSDPNIVDQQGNSDNAVIDDSDAISNDPPISEQSQWEQTKWSCVSNLPEVSVQWQLLLNSDRTVTNLGRGELDPLRTGTWSPRGSDGFSVTWPDNRSTDFHTLGDGFIDDGGSRCHQDFYPSSPANQSPLAADADSNGLLDAVEFTGLSGADEDSNGVLDRYQDSPIGPNVDINNNNVDDSFEVVITGGVDENGDGLDDYTFSLVQEPAYQSTRLVVPPLQAIHLIPDLGQLNVTANIVDNHQGDFSIGMVRNFTLVFDGENYHTTFTSEYGSPIFIEVTIREILSSGDPLQLAVSGGTSFNADTQWDIEVSSDRFSTAIDSDGDGFTNLAERIAGTNPFVANFMTFD